MKKFVAVFIFMLAGRAVASPVDSLFRDPLAVRDSILQKEVYDNAISPQDLDDARWIEDWYIKHYWRGEGPPTPTWHDCSLTPVATKA